MTNSETLLLNSSADRIHCIASHFTYNQVSRREALRWEYLVGFSATRASLQLHVWLSVAPQLPMLTSHSIHFLLT